MNESTRPDPKAQIGALFDVGRLMVEHELPAVDVCVRADGLSVSLEAYDHTRHYGGPATVDDLFRAFEAWAAVLGADEYARTTRVRLSKDGAWRQSASFYVEFAGLHWAFHGATAIPVPLVRLSPRVRLAVTS